MKPEEKKSLDDLLSRVYEQDRRRAEDFLKARGQPPRSPRSADAAGAGAMAGAGELTVTNPLGVGGAGWPTRLMRGAAVLVIIILSFQGVSLRKYYESPLSLRISQLAGDGEIQGWIKNDLPREWSRLIRSFGEEERNE